MWPSFHFSSWKKSSAFYAAASFPFSDFNSVVQEYILIKVIVHICCMCSNDISVVFYYKSMRLYSCNARCSHTPAHNHASKWSRTYNIVRMTINLHWRIRVSDPSKLMFCVVFPGHVADGTHVYFLAMQTHPPHPRNLWFFASCAAYASVTHTCYINIG